MSKQIAWYLRDARNLHYFAIVRPYLDMFASGSGSHGNRLVVSTADPAMADEEYRDFRHLFMVCESLDEFDLVVTPTWLRPNEHPQSTPVVQIFHGISDKPFTVERDFSRYAMTLCVGQQQLDRLLASPHNRTMPYRLVGYAKFDKPPVAASPFPTGERPTLIYAPTWRKGGFSSIERFLEPGVVDSLVERFNLIVKPHPNTFNPDRPYYDQGIVDQLTRLDDRETVSVVQAGNVLPYFAAADVCVADISSAGYEWLWFDRPAVFLNPDPDRFAVSRDMCSPTVLWQAGEVCDDPRALAATVNGALDRDRHAGKRQELLSYSMHMPHGGGAAARGAEAIREIIDGR